MAMFLEGLPYFLSPKGVRGAMRSLIEMGDGALRLVGLALMAVGLVVAYLATR